MKPLTVNINQVKRIMRQPIGSGFLVFRSSEDEFETAEFVLGEGGKILRPDGSRFTYIYPDGREFAYAVEDVT